MGHRLVFLVITAVAAMISADPLACLPLPAARDDRVGLSLYYLLGHIAAASIRRPLGVPALSSRIQLTPAALLYLC